MSFFLLVVLDFVSMLRIKSTANVSWAPKYFMYMLSLNPHNNPVNRIALTFLL